jgi:hypothetical protein
MNSDPMMKARNQRKLLMQTTRREDSECLIWTGQISNAGYGRIMLKTDDGNRMVTASRAAYELFIGPAGDRIVTQTCRNRLCVNPEHLELVDEIPRDHWHRKTS